MSLDILSIIPGKKHRTNGGWISFNAVCCHHRGHKPDRRMRAGIIAKNFNFWTYSCFNCGFKCGSSPGKQFSKSTKMLLTWLGIDKLDVDRLSFENYKDKNIYDFDTPYGYFNPKFTKKSLPEGSVPLDNNDPLHQKYIHYLGSRGLNLDSFSFYVTPLAERERDRNRIIIPYYFNRELVGHTSRYFSGSGPKYISDQQQGYVFNYDAQLRRSEVCIMVEGQIDAISIGGCAYLSSTISDEQVSLIKNLNRDVIVVPDRDKTGMVICDRALELGYRVSIPEWSAEIKDVNDAVIRYGRLPTLLSILEAATSSKIITEMKRKKFLK